jgi:hypothetical protein
MAARRISAENFLDPILKSLFALLVGYGSKALDTRMLSSAGLVIKAGGGLLAKTGGSACQAICAGVLRSIAAATDMAALSGTVTNAKFNVYCFFIDSAGVLTSAMGVEGATLAAVVFPPMPANKACIGFVIINPTGAGNFVGNTTALDDAGVVPNAVYVSLQGGFDPNYSQALLP